MRRFLLALCALVCMSVPVWAQTPYLSAPANSDAVCAQRCADDRFCHSWRRTPDGTCSLSIGVVRPEPPASAPRTEPRALSQLRGLSGPATPPVAPEPAQDLLGGPETETQS